MTPDQQTALGLSNKQTPRKEIASIMGKSEAAVKMLLERARKWENADKAAQVAANNANSNEIPHSFWVKTDTHSVYYQTPKSQSSVDVLAEIADAFANVPAYTPKKTPNVITDLLTVYPLMDAHFGMFSWGKETGGQDYDLALASSDLANSFASIMNRVDNNGTALLVLGGDTLHADDNRAETPQSKHKLDTDGRHYKAVEVAVTAICHTIDALCEKHSNVIVRVLRGNHDINAHLILHFALTARYRNAETVTIEDAERDLYWYRHGISLVAFHHGDKGSAQRLCMFLADTCPDWSVTRDRNVLTGHIHHDSIKDFPGVKWWSLRAFCPADEYGAMFGGRRALQAMTFCKVKGFRSQEIEPILRGV